MITILAFTMIVGSTSVVPILNGLTALANEQYAKFLGTLRFTKAILDNLGDTELLAQEALEDGVNRHRMVEQERDDEGNIIKPTNRVEINGASIDVTLPTEKRHRRLPRSRGLKLTYIQLVTAEVKAKLGTPTDNAANRLVIRRVARGFMETHGLRPAHQQSILSTVIEAVLTPGNEELEARRWGNSFIVRWRRQGGVPTWWSWVTGVSSSS